MKETGWVKVSASDVGPLHYEYAAEKAAADAAGTGAGAASMES